MMPTASKAASAIGPVSFGEVEEIRDSEAAAAAASYANYTTSEPLPERQKWVHGPRQTVEVSSPSPSTSGAVHAEVVVESILSRCATCEMVNCLRQGQCLCDYCKKHETVEKDLSQSAGVLDAAEFPFQPPAPPKTCVACGNWITELSLLVPCASCNQAMHSVCSVTLVDENIYLCPGCSDRERVSRNCCACNNAISPDAIKTDDVTTCRSCKRAMHRSCGIPFYEDDLICSECDASRHAKQIEDTRLSTLTTSDLDAE